MSMLPPDPPEYLGSEDYSADSRDSYSHDTPVSEAARRAGRVVWIAAGVLLLGSMCCVSSFAVLGFTSLDQLRAQDTDGNVPAEAWEEMARLRPYFPVVAGVIALLTLLPAAVLLVLGFSIRRGSRGAMRAAYYVTAIPLGTLALMLVLMLLGIATQGAAALFNALPVMALVALLLWAFITLRRTLNAPAEPLPYGDDGGDPWEHSL